MDNAEPRRFTMSELEEVTGTSRRTIRFYVKEGFIPPPEGEGGGAKYTDEHVLKMQAIKVMQDNHLKLKGIQEALAGMSHDEMKRFVADAGEGKGQWNAKSLEHWVHPSEGPAKSSRNFSFATFVKKETPAPHEQGNANILNKLNRRQSPNAESWKRFAILDGVELSIREDVPAETRNLVMHIIDQLHNQQ